MEKNKPIIGLTPQYDGKKNGIWTRPQYVDAIIKAGGIPVLLTQLTHSDDMEEILCALDGVLFTGGGDLHPRRYGEAVLPECGEIQEIRDDFELAFYKKITDMSAFGNTAQIPVLGICRGIQLINVAAGGTLHQHIDGHSDVRHNVEISMSGLLYDIYKTHKLGVNSYHHQAIKVTAPALSVEAVSDDGIVEAVSMPGAGFFAAVQWHPENMYEDDEFSRMLFGAFISACREYNAEKKRFDSGLK